MLGRGINSDGSVREFLKILNYRYIFLTFLTYGQTWNVEFSYVERYFFPRRWRCEVNMNMVLYGEYDSKMNMNEGQCKWI